MLGYSSSREKIRLSGSLWNAVAWMTFRWRTTAPCNSCSSTSCSSSQRNASITCPLCPYQDLGPREGHCCPKLCPPIESSSTVLLALPTSIVILSGTTVRLLPLCTHPPLLRPILPPCLPIQILLLGKCLRWGGKGRPSQARLALFFTRFNFILCYCSVSHNTKSDDLSDDHQLKAVDALWDTAITWHLDCMVGTVYRDIEKEVQSAQGTQTPDGCPPGQLFGPGPLHSRILQWGHSLLLNCHPMVSRTFNLLTQHFWWPSPQEDTWEFVSACVVSRGSKVSRSTLARHLRSLPVPRRPWSHILIDFVKFYFLSLFSPTYLRLPVLTLMCFTCASFSF